MINVVFMAKETASSMKSLDYLCKKEGVKVLCAVLREKDNIIREMCRRNGITIFSEKEFIEEKRRNGCKIDYIFSYYWKKVGKEILDIPLEGAINFHPGPLPEARGSGYHIAIMENWGYWGVTAHYMDEEYDTGNIIMSERFSINKITNRDLVELSHEKLFKLFQKVVDKIIKNEKLPSESQREGNYYDIKEIELQKTILPCDDEKVIERKIRAFWNPPYRGAQIKLAGKQYTVINDEILQWIAERIDDKHGTSNK